MAAGGLRLNVLIQPRARRTQIAGRHAGGLKIQVTAPPVDGAANEALIDLLASTLRIPRRSLRIVQGASSRQKVIEMDDTPACRQRLEALLEPRQTPDAAVDKEEPRR